RGHLHRWQYGGQPQHLKIVTHFRRVRLATQRNGLVTTMWFSVNARDTPSQSFSRNRHESADFGHRCARSTTCSMTQRTKQMAFSSASSPLSAEVSPAPCASSCGPEPGVGSSPASTPAAADRSPPGAETAPLSCSEDSDASSILSATSSRATSKSGCDGVISGGVRSSDSIFCDLTLSARSTKESTCEDGMSVDTAPGVASAIA